MGTGSAVRGAVSGACENVSGACGGGVVDSKSSLVGGLQNIGGASMGVSGASYSENPNSCVGGVVGANLQGRGGDFANLHGMSENIGGLVRCSRAVGENNGGINRVYSFFVRKTRNDTNCVRKTKNDGMANNEVLRFARNDKAGV